MNDEKPWADEPTPLCDEKEIYHSDIGYSSHALRYMDIDDARDLERRLRHSLKLVNSLRIDAECGDFDLVDLEQRLANIEETLTP